MRHNLTQILKPRGSRGLLFALLASTAMVSFAPCAARAADKVVDAGEEIVDVQETVDTLTIGTNEGDEGAITVVGPDGDLRPREDSFVGDAGTGTLTIEDGGAFRGGDDIFIGNQAGSTGTVTVQGENSFFSMVDKTKVGFTGTGFFNVLDGAGAQSGGDMAIGVEAGSHGTATVSGTGSTLKVIDDDVIVGEAGVGVLNVTNGGFVDVGDRLIVGLSASSNGTVNVTGVNSRLIAGESITVGASGVGTMNVLSGGTVHAGDDISIGNGDSDDPAAHVTVSGLGSSMTTNARIFVGSDTASELSVLDGGVVTAADLVHIENEGGGEAAKARVSGKGSRLVAHGQLVVGGEGRGTLTVSDGGAVEADDGLKLAILSGSGGVLAIGGGLNEEAKAAGTVEGENGAVANIDFGNGEGAIVFNHTDNDYEFDATVSGDGSIMQVAGFTRLTGDYSDFSGGSAEINGGTLAVDTDFLGDVAVNLGGILRGTGSVGDTNFATGSFFAVDLSAADHLVTDELTIEEGAKVLVTAQTVDELPLDETVTIIEWTPFALTGEFAGVVDNFLFFDLLLGQDANTFNITASRNELTFADLAATGNQAAVGGSVESLGAGNPIFDSLLLSASGEDFQDAIDQLSGEATASMQGALTEGSGFSRDIVNSRMRSSFGSIGGRTADQTTTASVGYSADPATPKTGYDLWGQVYGGFGQTRGDGNAASQDHASGGLFVGIETGFASDWRAGIFTGYGHTRTEVGARNSDSDADSFTFGAYAGRLYGPVRVQYGSSVSYHAVSSSRDVDFGGFSDHLEADYDAVTLQGFGEIGYAIATPSFELEPFAGAALVYQHSDGFTEKGGAAALTASSSDQTLAITTVGVRTARDIGVVGKGMRVSLDGAVAWRHAFGDVKSQSTMAFASGSDPFTVSGLPVDRDTALIEAGVSIGLASNTDLSFGYAGTFGESQSDNVFNAKLKARF